MGSEERKKWIKIPIPAKYGNEPIPTPTISPLSLSSKATIKELVEIFSRSNSFQAGRLAQACRIYQKMLEEDAGIALTLAGAMTPTGMGGLIAQMIEFGAIDWIISTGANVFHDLHFALGLPVHQGNFKVDDRVLKEKNIDRIYDIFLGEEVITRTDCWILEAIKPLRGEKLSTAQLHYHLGKCLLEDGFEPQNSFVASAAKYQVPIYTSSPGDSEIGLDLAYARLIDFEIELDPIQDVIETTAIVNGLEKNGVIIVGGGSPKNFYLQTQPMLKAGLGIEKRGHDYDIQITVDSPHWGGLSGATPEEAVSWGKIKPEQLNNSVVVYSDATLALPIILGYVLQTCSPRPHKKLYSQIPELVKRLKKEMKKFELMPEL